MRIVRTTLIAALLVVGLFVVLSILNAPQTPEARFSRKTGFEFPTNATIIEDGRDYTVGMVESFSSEGTSIFSFSTDAATINKMLAASPPWQSAWERGKVPLWVNEKTPISNNVAMAMRGDMGNGDMLAIDPDTKTVWLFGWDW